MKKVFAIFAVAALCLCACNKEEASKGGKKDNGKTDDKQPEYVAPITIDGDFADWAALDASKVAVATCAEGAVKDALKTVKVYADEYYVFVYFEFDPETISDRAWVPFHLYFNGDNSAETGGYGDQYSDADTDLLCEGAIFAEDEFCSYDPGAFQWVGEVGANGWDWEEVLAEGAGMCSGMGKGNAYEICVIREMYPLGTLADTFTMGFDIQQNWSSVGILPNATPTEDNTNGLAPKLVVTTVK